MRSRNCTAYFTDCIPCPEVNIIRANNKLITSESSNTARIYATGTQNLSVEHLDIVSGRKASKKRTQKKHVHHKPDSVSRWKPGINQRSTERFGLYLTENTGCFH